MKNPLAWARDLVRPSSPLELPEVKPSPLIWITDPDGDVESMLDTSEVIAMHRVGVQVHLTFYASPIRATHQFRSEEIAATFANTVAQKLRDRYSEERDA